MLRLRVEQWMGGPYPASKAIEIKRINTTTNTFLLVCHTRLHLALFLRISLAVYFYTFEFMLLRGTNKTIATAST